MKSLNGFILLGLTFMLFTGCHDDLTFELINLRREVIEVAYDDRMYRSDLESVNPTIVTRRLEPDSVLFLGVGSDKMGIWPYYIEIRLNNDTIKVIGRDAIFALTHGDKLTIK